MCYYFVIFHYTWILSQSGVMCVGFISGAPKSHQLICTLNFPLRIFYTMNKRMPFAKSIRTYFYCMLFHPLLSSHFIHMDFFQKINLSIRISLWAAGFVLWGVYQNSKTNFVLLNLLNSTKVYKERNLRCLLILVTKSFCNFFVPLNTNEQG